MPERSPIGGRGFEPTPADGPDSYGDQIAAAARDDTWGLSEALVGIVAAVLLSTIIGGLILAAAGWKSVAETPMWGFGVIQIPMWLTYLGFVIVAGAKGRGPVVSFGIRVRPLDVPVGLLVGVVLQLLVLPALYIPIFELTGTTSEELSGPAKELAGQADGIWSWALFAVLVGLVAPVVEEIFFRGLLLRSISKKGAGVVAAVVASSAIFASLHLQLLQFPGLFLFGIVAAVMAVLSARLGMSMFAHIGFNLTTVVVLYLDYRSRIG